MAGGLVRSRSGMGNSLWRTSSAGLRLPSSRTKIPLNGLVFYAPLWHPELAGSTFKTKDPNTLTCTVTGATWGSQGRTFDGVDDKIVATETTTLNLIANFTFAIWVKPITNAGGLVVLAQKRSDVNNYPYVFIYNEAAGEIRLYSNAGSSANVNSTGTSALSSWLFAVVTRATTTINFYLNGSADTGNPQTLAQGTSDSASGLRLGLSYNDANDLKGVMGDTFIYNRALSSVEVQNIYLATKWRYS